MSSWRELIALALLAAATSTAGAQTAAPAAATSSPRASAATVAPVGARHAGIGRAATPSELAAWDTDVRPDFKGLPKGSGSVARGQDVWEAKCASCHGVFGESNSTFNPVVGGTTTEDVTRGRVARLNDPAFPGRTMLMKVATLSTIWDYIRRAMPWNEPKSLSVDEVYALTAFILNLGDIVPADYVLSDANMAATQARMPNRDGMTREHALWPGAGARRPDVQGSACMTNCGPEPKVASQLPEFARNAHGNLALQNRSVGAQHGADTAPAGAPAASSPKATVTSAATSAVQLLSKHGCVACHGVDTKIVGPSLAEVATTYASRPDRVAYLQRKIVSGGSGVWGATPMPPQTLDPADVRAIAQWLAAGAPR